MNYGLMAYYFFLVCVTIGVLFWFIYNKVFKHRVIVRNIANNRKIVKIYPARSYKDKEGCHYWRLWGEKDKALKLIPVPPSEVIEISPKGKYVAECYRFPTGDIAWIKDSNQVMDPPTDFEVPQEIINEIMTGLPEDIQKIKREEEKKIKTTEWLDIQIDDYRKKVISEWKAQHHIVEAFQPVTTNQRQITINNYAKAAQRRTKSTMDKVVQYIPLGALVLIIIFGMLVWKDLAQPVLDARDREIESQKIQQESLKILKEISGKVQRIDGSPVNVEPKPNS